MAALSRNNGVERPHADLGSRIREERLFLGLTQEAFAKQLGVHRKTQGNYESGAREPDAAYLSAASKSGVDIGYVLTGERASGAHRALVRLVDVIFDALRLTPHEMEFADICQLAYLEETAAVWREGRIKGEGKEAARATAALIKKSPLVIDEAAFTDLIERLEFVLESAAIDLTHYDKARAILQLYSLAKSQGKPLDLQTIRSVVEGFR